jgi:hypothetical protein
MQFMMRDVKVKRSNPQNSRLPDAMEADVLAFEPLGFSQNGPLATSHICTPYAKTGEMLPHQLRQRSPVFAPPSRAAPVQVNRGICGLCCSSFTLFQVLMGLQILGRVVFAS